jgi:hypothetical protein
VEKAPTVILVRLELLAQRLLLVMLVQLEQLANLVVRVLKVIRELMELKEPKDQLVLKAQLGHLVHPVLQVQRDLPVKLVAELALKVHQDQQAKKEHQVLRVIQVQVDSLANLVLTVLIALVQNVFSPRRTEFKEYRKLRNLSKTFFDVFKKCFRQIS